MRRLPAIYSAALQRSRPVTCLAARPQSRPPTCLAAARQPRLNRQRISLEAAQQHSQPTISLVAALLLNPLAIYLAVPPPNLPNPDYSEPAAPPSPLANSASALLNNHSRTRSVWASLLRRLIRSALANPRSSSSSNNNSLYSRASISNSRVSWQCRYWARALSSGKCPSCSD